MNAISGVTFFVTRNAIPRHFITPMGEWTPDREDAERFTRKDLASQAAARFPGSFVVSFFQYGFRNEESDQ